MEYTSAHSRTDLHTHQPTLEEISALRALRNNLTTWNMCQETKEEPFLNRLCNTTYKGFGDYIIVMSHFTIKNILPTGDIMHTRQVGNQKGNYATNTKATGRAAQVWYSPLHISFLIIKESFIEKPKKVTIQRAILKT